LLDCAVKNEQNPNRLHPENESKTRSVFLRDGDRVVHTTAFRRLTDKTQVWIDANRDHYRTRLTHTIEVTRAARSIAQNLGLNAELAEVIALTHDIGHPPFGHMGEDILNTLMQDVGGFDHNAHALQIVTYLSSPKFEYDGLNLAWDSLEGIAKHNGPFQEDKIPFVVKHYNKYHNLRLDTFASAEAQVASLSDDIVYNCHDLQDGMRSEKLTLDEILEISAIKKFCERIDVNCRKQDPHRFKAKILRITFGYFVNDLIQESQRILNLNNFKKTEEIRQFGRPVICFSEEANYRLHQIKDYLSDNLYKLDLFDKKKHKVKPLLTELFNYYLNDTSHLPDHWQKLIDKGLFGKKRLIGDYIAGMTDRYTIRTALNKKILCEEELEGIM